MEVIFHVRNFGKIKSADINISNFALFVGNNNSGKTMLMELIYAVLDIIVDELHQFTIAKDIQSAGVYNIGEGEIQSIVNDINRYLAENKDFIMREYFNSNQLKVESIFFTVSDIGQEYQIRLEKENEETIKGCFWCKSEIIRITFEGASLSESADGYNRYESAAEFLIKFLLEEILLNRITKRGITQFLPAARNGYLMTYRAYFSKNNARKSVTMPVHDFLTFLQEYNYDAKNESYNQKTLDFIYENIIDGKIVELGDSTYYVPKGTQNYVPLPLASSMVNELVPITKMLTNYEDTRFLFFDEVETSMHPSKQMEMVRLLNRLNNNGMRMIISTHSDSMAMKINNLLLLKHADRPFSEIQATLKKKGITLEEEDILKGDIHAYQFVNGDDGMSTVEELEFREYPCTGFDFTLFNDSATNLYEEAKTVMGLDE